MKAHPRPGWVAAAGLGAGALFAARRFDGLDISTALDALHFGAIAVLVLAGLFVHCVATPPLLEAVVYASAWNALQCTYECLSHAGMRAAVGHPPIGVGQASTVVAALVLAITAVRAALRLTDRAAARRTPWVVASLGLGHAAGWWACREARSGLAAEDLPPLLELSLLASTVGPFTVMALPIWAAFALRGELSEPVTRSWAVLLATASLLAWSCGLLARAIAYGGPSEISLAWHGSSIGEIVAFGIVVYLAARAALSTLVRESEEDDA